jgi:hypothetical protein
MDTWHHEMRRANGETFHMSFLSFFRLHVRLFLNSFGIQAAMSPVSFRPPLSGDPRIDRELVEPHHSERTGAISVLYERQGKFAYCLAGLCVHEHARRQRSALCDENLPTLYQRYGQESITVMTAYSAVFLLKVPLGIFFERCRLSDPAVVSFFAAQGRWPSYTRGQPAKSTQSLQKQPMPTRRRRIYRQHAKPQRIMRGFCVNWLLKMPLGLSNKDLGTMVKPAVCLTLRSY